MTFDLKEGAHVVVENYVSGETQNGTYMLSLDDYSLKFTDAGMLHEPGGNANVADWGDTRVMYLDENVLQLGVVRIEDPCLLVYNFISADYRDNWTPSEVESPSEPVLPDGWQNIVGQITQTSIKWTLSTQNPVDWCNMDGSRMNGWNSPADYPDWLGVPDPSVYEGFSLTMDSSTFAYEMVAPDGTEVSGTYTLDEKGVYTFDNALPSFAVVGWASFAADANNQLRIMSINTNASGVISDMWVGAKSDEKEEYMAYHLIANVGNGGSQGSEVQGYDAKIYFATSSWWPSGDGAVTQVTGDGSYTCVFNLGVEANDAYVFAVDIVGLRAACPVSSARVTSIRYDGAEVSFDPAKVVYGDLEGNGNLRIEITNAFGPSNGDPAIDPSAVHFTELAVDFEVKYEAYEAQIMMINQGWWPSETVTAGGILGTGKHKLSAAFENRFSAPMIFCIDLLGYASAVEDISAVKGSVHSMKINGETDATLRPENLAYGDLENKGNFRWEFFNIYGPTSGGSSDSNLNYADAVIYGTEFTDVGSLEIYVSIDN